MSRAKTPQEGSHGFSIPSRSDGGVKQLLTYAGSHRSQLYLSIVLAVVGELFGMVPYVAVALFVAAFLNGSATTTSVLMFFLAALLGQAIKEFLTFHSTVTSHRATYSILSDMRRAVARKMERVPLGAMIDTPTGTHKKLLVDTISQLEDSMAHFMPEVTSNVVAPLVTIIVLFIVDWRMGLAAFVTLPIAALCYCGMMYRYQERMSTYTQAGNDMNSALVEYVNGIQVIKAFGQSASSFEAYSKAVNFFHTSTLAWYRQCWFWSAGVQAIMPCTLLGTLPIGLFLYMQGSLSLPALMLGLILPLGFIAPLMRVSVQSENFVMMKERVDRITEFLNQDELQRPAARVELSDTRIELDGVHFSYGKTEVLHGIDLTIEPCTMCAFVGPSGSGKSTVAKLLAGYWDPDAGAVRVGGADIRTMPAAQLSEHISYVAQDTFLFDATIRQNIRIGRPDATDEEVETAARLAAADGFIRALPEGYDTRAGDAGDALSGGERQRITIARAFLKNAPIVILDEATAFIDPESEVEIQNALSRLIQGKTLIVIAHRLSTVRMADAIVVLENGLIQDKGTHEELMKRCGLYRDMWASGGFDHAEGEDA